jgi:hypothetical protein
MRLAPALRHMLVHRMHAAISPRRGHVGLGDFGRHAPPLDQDEVSVYDALVRRFLRPRLDAFGGSGLVLGVDAEPGWADVLSAGANVEVFGATSGSEFELAAAENTDWVVLDRCLQMCPEMALALDEVVVRLRAGAGLVTFFTGIARAEPGDRAPLWSVAPYAARRLHEECRELERVEVDQYGNVTLALAWIYRLPAHDLTEGELAAVDPAYPVLVAVTASKRGGPL